MSFLAKPALAALLVAGSLSLPAQAATYNFNCFEGCGPIPAGLGGQMAVSVVDHIVTAATNDVLFTFSNAVGIPSSITRGYFDNGLTGLINSIAIHAQSAGVNFAVPANPANVPGGQNIAFFADVSAGSLPPTLHNGINAASEYLTILANLSPGSTFNDVTNAMNSGALRVALHVQGIPTGDYSASFVNVVPEPETWATLLAGLGLLGLKMQRRYGRQS